MKEQFSRFDAAEFLIDETTIAHYLSAALDDANTDVFIAALSDVARARGITQMAKTAGVGRESLYKTLAPGSKPRYETIRKLLDTLGVKLMVVPGQAGTTAALAPRAAVRSAPAINTPARIDRPGASGSSPDRPATGQRRRPPPPAPHFAGCLHPFAPPLD